MFDIAWSEFLVVAVVALVVVGPKDLPALLRTVGKTIASLRRMAGEFQGQFNEAMREAELDGLKDELTGMRDKTSRMIGASPFQIARDEIKNALTDKPKSTPSALAGDADAAKAEGAADVPSALAPPPPIEPTPEPPAPTAADFAIKAAPAMRPVEAAPAAAPAQAKAAARKAASGAAADAKPAARKRAPAKPPASAEAPKAARPRKAPAKKKTEQTPPGASA